MDVDLSHDTLIEPNDYPRWLAIASRHARRRDEASDLLQDALLIAIEAGRTDLSDEHNRAWLSGVIVKQAAMTARSAARRRARESNHRPVESTPSTNGDSDALLTMIRQLPRSARIVATLALHGMTRDEIAYVLDLAPTALRQRLATIRRACKDAPPDSGAPIMTIGQELETGVLRRSLLAVVHQQPGLGIHDPDGHLIVIERDSTSQRSISRQRKGNSNRRR